MKVDKVKQSPQSKTFSSSKKLLQNILHAIPDLISVIDKDFRIIFSNWRGGYEYVSPEQRKKTLHCYEAYYPEQGAQ
jgi:two-component system cell cycle sensor histidine kinase/response regulator CckA